MLRRTPPQVALSLLLLVPTFGPGLGVAAPQRPASPASDTLEPKITVGPNVYVSGALPKKFHHEFGVCADPKNPKELAVSVMYADMVDSASYSVAIYTSHDGGLSWQLALN